MDRTTLISTFFLTLLMLIGLVFFIRASVKDRTEVLKMGSVKAVDALEQDLRQYFDQRSYSVKSLDRDRDLITWEGLMQPSLPLAILLSFLATIGLFCLSLVLLLAVPAVGPSWFAVMLFAPAAGSFYWKRAERMEEVSYRILEPGEAVGEESEVKSLLSISAHRDEILSLQQALPFQELV